MTHGLHRGDLSKDGRLGFFVLVIVDLARPNERVRRSLILQTLDQPLTVPDRYDTILAKLAQQSVSSEPSEEEWRGGQGGWATRLQHPSEVNCSHGDGVDPIGRDGVDRLTRSLAVWTWHVPTEIGCVLVVFFEGDATVSMVGECAGVQRLVGGKRGGNNVWQMGFRCRLVPDHRQQEDERAYGLGVIDPGATGIGRREMAEIMEYLKLLDPRDEKRRGSACA